MTGNISDYLGIYKSVPKRWAHIIKFLDNFVLVHLICAFSSKTGPLVDKDNFHIQLTELAEIYDSEKMRRKICFSKAISK